MSQIAAWRGPSFGLLGYWHHGVLCPDGTVIHYTTGSHLRDKVQPRSKQRAKIIRTHMEHFRKEAPAVYDVVPGPTVSRLPLEEAVARAESRLGEATYSLLFNNCETFAYWCVIGEKKSRQISHHMRYVVRGFVPFGLPGAVAGIFASALKMSVGDVRRQRMKIRALLGGNHDDEEAEEVAEDTGDDVPGQSAEMPDEQNETFVERTASKRAEMPDEQNETFVERTASKSAETPDEQNETFVERTASKSAEMPDEQKEIFVESTASKSAKTASKSAKTLADTPAKKSGKTPAKSPKKTFIARAQSAKFLTRVARGESRDMLQDFKDATINAMGGKAAGSASAAVPRAQSAKNLTKRSSKAANKPRVKPVDIPTEGEMVPNPGVVSVTSSRSLA